MSDIDHLIAKKLKERRLVLGLSQTDLAKALDISFQQVQKYEKGINKISISRLFKISQSLGVKISYFFSQEDEDLFLSEEQEEYNLDNNLDKKEIISLVKNYSKIKDSIVRKKILSLIKSISENSDLV